MIFPKILMRDMLGKTSVVSLQHVNAERNYPEIVSFLWESSFV